jgi:hypothetical protein
MRQDRFLEPIQFRPDRHARPTSKLEPILSALPFSCILSGAHDRHAPPAADSEDAG